MSQKHTLNRLIKKADLNSFENTYRENYPKMFGIAKRMVTDEDVVKDIVQEIFVCYYERLQNGLAVYHPQSWLVRATVNKCVDHLGQRKKHTQLSVVSQSEAAEESTDRFQPDLILRQALSELKPREMKLVTLYSEGYSYKEIAEIAEINFSSVGKTLSRTLDKLKGILKKMNYEMY